MNAAILSDPVPVFMPAVRERYDRLDAWRGLAIVWMACFHFSFDLNLPDFGYMHPRQNFYLDPFWTDQRFCIVSLFLLGAGAGQAVAIHLGQTWARFWRRWIQVAGCAALVSLGSALSAGCRSAIADISARPPVASSVAVITPPCRRP